MIVLSVNPEDVDNLEELDPLHLAWMCDYHRVQSYSQLNAPLLLGSVARPKDVRCPLRKLGDEWREGELMEERMWMVRGLLFGPRVNGAVSREDIFAIDDAEHGNTNPVDGGCVEKEAIFSESADEMTVQTSHTLSITPSFSMTCLSFILPRNIDEAGIESVTSNADSPTQQHNAQISSLPADPDHVQDSLDLLGNTSLTLPAAPLLLHKVSLTTRAAMLFLNISVPDQDEVIAALQPPSSNGPLAIQELYAFLARQDYQYVHLGDLCQYLDPSTISKRMFIFAFASHATASSLCVHATGRPSSRSARNISCLSFLLSVLLLLLVYSRLLHLGSIL